LQYSGEIHIVPFLILCLALGPSRRLGFALSRLKVFNTENKEIAARPSGSSV
jgi:hypothetical protein